MKASFKLAAIALALGAALSAQASPQNAGFPQAPLGDRPIGTMTHQMTSSFGGATGGGTLRAEVWDIDPVWGSGMSNIFYQITNNAGSVDPILSAFSTGGSVSEMDIFTSAGNWYGQTPNAFGGFVRGTAESAGLFGYMYEDRNVDDGVITPTEYDVEMRFTQNPGEIGNTFNGITPGNSSFIGMVGVYGILGNGIQGRGFRLGTVDVGGYSVATYVSAVPEPETYAMLLAGLGLIGTMVKRRKAQPA
jgi:hypothetical protein